MSIKAFSVVSDPEHPGAKRLSRSAEFWGWDHKFIIQKDQPEGPKPFKIWLPTYRAEQLGQLDFIRQYDPEFCMYVDGWDSVFTGPPQELQFKRGCLAFGGDTVLYPENTSQPMASFPNVGWEEYRFVNCGAIWGDARVMAELAADYLQNSPETLLNQAYYNRRVAFELGVGRSRLSIDTRAEVVINIMLLQKRWFRFKANRVEYTALGSRPVVLHVPGWGSADKAVPLPQELEELYGN
jgi:hypothetical protein